MHALGTSIGCRGVVPFICSIRSISADVAASVLRLSVTCWNTRRIASSCTGLASSARVLVVHSVASWPAALDGPSVGEKSAASAAAPRTASASAGGSAASAAGLAMRRMSRGQNTRLVVTYGATSPLSIIVLGSKMTSAVRADSMDRSPLEGLSDGVPPSAETVARCTDELWLTQTSRPAKSAGSRNGCALANGRRRWSPSTASPSTPVLGTCSSKVDGMSLVSTARCSA